MLHFVTTSITKIVEYSNVPRSFLAPGGYPGIIVLLIELPNHYQQKCKLLHNILTRDSQTTRNSRNSGVHRRVVEFHRQVYRIADLHVPYNPEYATTSSFPPGNLEEKIRKFGKRNKNINKVQRGRHTTKNNVYNLATQKEQRYNILHW